MSDRTQKATLVIGGTGKTGRRVVERLRAAGVPVRDGSRSGEPPFGWEDAATWAPRAAGRAGGIRVFFPDLAVPGAAAAVGAFAELVESGVRRLVLLSAAGRRRRGGPSRPSRRSGRSPGPRPGRCASCRSRSRASPRRWPSRGCRTTSPA